MRQKWILEIALEKKGKTHDIVIALYNLSTKSFFTKEKKKGIDWEKLKFDFQYMLCSTECFAF